MTNPFPWEIVTVAGTVCGLIGGVLLLWPALSWLRYLGVVLFPALVPAILASVFLFNQMEGVGEIAIIAGAAFGYAALLLLTSVSVAKTGDIARKARQFEASQIAQRRKEELRQTLSAKTVARYRLPDDERQHIVIMQGGIADILTSEARPDVVVNSENDFMMLGRPFDANFSGSLRDLDAVKDDSGYITVDAMEDALSAKLGTPRRQVRLGQVFETEATGLKRFGVKYVFHVATVRPRRRNDGFTADPKEIPNYIEACFAKYIELVRTRENTVIETILFPLIGAGDGGVPSEDAAKVVFPSIVREMARYGGIRETYVVAFREGDREALLKAARTLSLVAD